MIRPWSSAIIWIQCQGQQCAELHLHSTCERAFVSLSLPAQLIYVPCYEPWSLTLLFVWSLKMNITSVTECTRMGLHQTPARSSYVHDIAKSDYWLIHLCLSVRPLEKTRLQKNKLSLNIAHWEVSLKSAKKPFKIGQKYQVPHVKTSVYVTWW